jgi:hypothetical protein
VGKNIHDEQEIPQQATQTGALQGVINSTKFPPLRMFLFYGKPDFRDISVH